jgi:phage-related protein
MRSIEFYRTARGTCPVEEFLDNLPDKQSQKVVWVLRLVERMDRVPEQYLKKLVGTREIWEIRAQSGGNSYRFLGFFDGPILLILTSAFLKKSRKAPTSEIALAEKRRQDYLQRKQQP